ncbi:MAG: MerC domain-containing protein [Saprospiraceae bacterium]|nr:MerC domain-containing protein [Bacteroidia bacterium]NNL92541.1 MerC domain-containing protein [Saprospiraceae bacterium]
MKKLIKSMDFWGGTSSFLCAIHCAILPILISLGLLQSQSWLSYPIFEIIMIGITIYFVYNSLIKGYMQGLVTKATFYTAIFGLFLVCIHHFMGGFSSIIIAAGGFTIAAAHFVNFFVSAD